MNDASWAIFFGWPYGAIWGNLLASLIWALPTLVIGIYKLRQHQRSVHHKLDMINEKLKKQ